MNIRKRLFAFMLAFTMVLTYMPALAFADTSASAVPTKVIWNRVDSKELTGPAGENYIDGDLYYADGNKITIEYSDGSSKVYICKTVGDYVGYFPNGDVSGDYQSKDISGLIKEEILNESGLLEEGPNTVRLVADVGENRVYSDTFTVTGVADPDDPYDPDAPVAGKLIWDRGDVTSEVRGQIGDD